MIQKTKINIKFTHKDAKIPYKDKEGNIGYDLYAADEVIIPTLSRAKISTGVNLGFPSGYWAELRDRSGMAAKNGGTVLAGIIDTNYTGEVCIILYNTDKDKELVIKKGDRPAQMIFWPNHEVYFNEVEELNQTERGDKGFGSSGGITLNN